ncbi:hypothetical protein ABID23_001646 [Bartonella silvatica]|uniref:Uncharacterized protein n=1 Tax=Bartonella silvatica TaxID=357760 RepID=A0ABV2HIZ5_9HYPH
MQTLSLAYDDQQSPSLPLLGMAGLFPQSIISILLTVVLSSGDRKYQQASELFIVNKSIERGEK